MPQKSFRRRTPSASPKSESASSQPRARHFIEHEHRWPDGRRHECSYDWPLPAGAEPKTILLRLRLFLIEGTWGDERFLPGEVAARVFPVQRIVLSRILTTPDQKPRILYGCDTPAHMRSTVQELLIARVRRDLELHFESLKSAGKLTGQEGTIHLEGEVTSQKATTTSSQVIHDIPLGEYQDSLFPIVKARVDRLVLKRFAALPDVGYDAVKRKWPRRCFASAGVFFDEALGEFRQLGPDPRHSPPTEESRGVGLTVLIMRELVRRSRPKPLDELYRELHLTSVSEERTEQMSRSLLEDLINSIPALAALTNGTPDLQDRLLEAIHQRSGVGFDGSRATHYQGTYFLARHLAAIAIGFPTDDDTTLKSRQELISRRMEVRNGRIRLLAHAPRRIR